MTFPCTQNTDRECREEDCCLNNSDKSHVFICCECQAVIFIAHRLNINGHVFHTVCEPCYMDLKRYEHLYIENSKGK